MVYKKEEVRALGEGAAFLSVFLENILRVFIRRIYINPDSPLFLHTRIGFEEMDRKHVHLGADLEIA
jgi:hypothetical protein